MKPKTLDPQPAGTNRELLPCQACVGSGLAPVWTAEERRLAQLGQLSVCGGQRTESHAIKSYPKLPGVDQPNLTVVSTYKCPEKVYSEKTTQE